MAYKAWGDHTGRFSGADGLNVQNLPNLHRSQLRKALVAPPGYVIHVADSSQIELRLQLWFSGQHDLLYKLANGEDLYSEVASAIYKQPVTKANKLERGVGKATELGCQYGMGADKYRAYMAGGPLGLDPLFFTENEAHDAVTAYRTTHPMTISMWRRLDELMPSMLHDDCDIELGPIRLQKERILLPNNTALDYMGLRQLEEGSWAYGVNGTIKFLWGGTLLENLTQALAKIVVTDQAVQIDREIAPVIGWTHDENLILGPEANADERQAAIEEVMRQPPSWAPDLPLDAEGGFDRAYTK
jgi:DNA polymerase